MKIIFLALILLNINEKVLIECSCIANNLSTSNLDEPIVGASFTGSYFFICLNGTYDKYRYCIRTIDSTGNYSPYLHYKQDENSLFVATEYYNKNTLRNVKNNLYLATLSNGFVYYSSTKDTFSEWTIKEIISDTYDPAYNIQLIHNSLYKLYSNNYFNLNSIGGASFFDIINLSVYTSDVKICLYTSQEYCIRTIDNTGSYSPYLSTSNDQNIYFTLTKYEKLSNLDMGVHYTFRNKINNLYLASLPNGFIYYSPSIEPNSKWYLRNAANIINNDVLIRNFGNGLLLNTKEDRFNLVALEKLNSYDGNFIIRNI